MKETVRAAVVQDGSIPFDPAATTLKACALIREAAANGADLVVLPEAFLGTYPKGLTFDAPLGARLPEGRDEFRRYHDGAVAIDGPEMAAIAACAAEEGIFVVMGIIEREGGTLYCTSVHVDPVAGLAGKHRKLMPTAAERLVWGFGDGSTIGVVEAGIGRIGSVICWENYMPALRMAMYAQGIELYCAPTVDDRETWLGTMRHIAQEGRCYVLSACQFITRADFGGDYRGILGNAPGDVLIRGGSTIVGPLGEVIAAPVFGRPLIHYADLDRATLVRSRMDFDPVGHYARPDVFRLEVDTRPKPAVRFG